MNLLNFCYVDRYQQVVQRKILTRKNGVIIAVPRKVTPSKMKNIRIALNNLKIDTYTTFEGTYPERLNDKYVIETFAEHGLDVRVGWREQHTWVRTGKYWVPAIIVM